MKTEKRIALVTGAGSGIGRASALALLEDGFRVVLAGRREAELRNTADMAGKNAANALPVSADVADPESVKRLFATLMDRHGRLDVLFNNAGVSLPPMPSEDVTPEQWDYIMRINVTGSFLCAQQALRIMKNQTPQGGRIINNGSISAHAPRVKAMAYAVSKHAITGLTKSICLDYRDDNICCSQIDIGNVDSGLLTTVQGGVRPQPAGGSRAEAKFSVSLAADAIVYLANLPLEANVPFMTLMANAMPYMGRG